MNRERDGGRGVKTSKSLPSLPRGADAGAGDGGEGSRGVGGNGGGRGKGKGLGRKTAKEMILQNPGLAGLEGLHFSGVRSLEDLGGGRR